MTDRRRFGRRERAALLTASGGRCSLCGCELSDEWHADHIRPWSAGGQTDVTNGQALCPGCNLKKGGQMADGGSWPEQITLREWQREFLRHYLLTGITKQPNYLLEACPGAGKTIAAGRAFHEKRRVGEVNFLIVVVSSEHLKRQWRDELSKLGIQIMAEWAPDQLVPPDMDGFAVCYNTVASASLAVRREIGRNGRRTMAIGDEWHHLGEHLEWGRQSKEALDPCVCRLLLSGTPFRSDNAPIPYVVYQKDDKGRMVSRPDYQYAYGRALADGVVRPIAFALFDGQASWWDGQWQQASVTDDVSAGDESKIIRVILDGGGRWLPDVIREADAKLSEIRRNGHPDAAGLVVARDQREARVIRALIKTCCGEVADIAISDEPEASGVIKAFSKNSRRWLVTVRMVSEGVDIRRLRVGVYATNTRTEMFFRQFVGRFVRMIGGLEDETAFMFIPSLRTLREFATAIKLERNHALMDEKKREPGGTIGGGNEGDVLPDQFLPGQTSEAIPDGFIFDGAHQTAALMDEVAAWRDAVARSTPEAKGIDLLKLAPFYADMVAKMGAGGVLAGREPSAPACEMEPLEQPKPSLEERKKALRESCNRMVRQIIASQGLGEKGFSVVNSWLNERLGVKRITDCSEEQLLRRIELARESLSTDRRPEGDGGMGRDAQRSGA